MPNTRGELSIIACKSGEPFAKKVFEKLKEKDSAKIVPSRETQFANFEIKTVIDESIRGADVYIFQDVENSDTGLSVDENQSILKSTIDAACRSDAGYITAVIPVFPYARQDKADGREPITASRIAREIEDAGADYVITLDVHNTAIAGYFRRARFENLHASKNIINYIKENPGTFDLEKLVLMPVDSGGTKRAEHYAEMLGTDLALAYKKRNPKIPNSVKEIRILGEIKGMDVFIIDDMICTAGSMIKIITKAKEKGARKVYAGCSLALFNGNAVEKLTKAHEEGLLEAVIGTDAVYHGKDFQKKNPWFREVSIASYVAKVIYNMNHMKSISELLL